MPAPSPWLRAAAAIIRQLLVMVLIGWTAFGVVWGGLHWVIVPRIDQIRPLLEARASQVLGVTVQIGSVTAQSDGAIPSFELDDVRLLDPEGRVALRLPRITATLSPRSLLALKFEQLYVERPTLDIRRNADGRLLVAGLDLTQSAADETRVADWFFSQPELVIRHGTLSWTDEMRGAPPPLALNDVDLVVRYKAHRHSMRFDATPAAEWGRRFQLMAVMRQPLLTLGNGRWREWQGELYANFDHVDLSQLRRYADVGVDVDQGKGALRAWADFKRGEISAATADLALEDVATTLKPGLEPLRLHNLTGRLSGSHDAASFDVATEGLQFSTADGLHWPGGNVRLHHTAAVAGKRLADPVLPERTDFKADRLDLAALSQIAQRLPLDASVRGLLERHTPAGLVEQITASWQGALENPTALEAQGHVASLAVAADYSGQVPGIQGATVDFKLTSNEGKATVVVNNGALVLPGVFDEPVVPVTQLSTDLRWQRKGEQWSVQLGATRFANADAQGEFQAKWQTADPIQAANKSRFPGVLEMQGSLSRAEAHRAHRYLPLVLPLVAREYVRDAVVQGKIGNTQFKLRGDLLDMPFTDPRRGEFRVAARLQDVQLAYLPARLQSVGEAPWPALTQLSGDLVFDRASMQVKGARGQMGQIQMLRGDAQIAEIGKASTLAVQLDARGPLSEMLGVVNVSPLSGWTGQVMHEATATGSADLKLKLNLKLAAIDKSTVQGGLSLSGNELQISPASPRLTQVRGGINFTDTGFSLSGVQARLLGGEARLEGGTTAQTVAAPNATAGSRSQPEVQLRAQGVIGVDGLRQATDWGLLAPLGNLASGTTTYNAVLSVHGGQTSLSISSNLNGLALNLPAPLNKGADATLPMRLEQTVLPLPGGAKPGTMPLEQWRLDLGRALSLAYVMDVSGKAPRVVRGGIGMGLADDDNLVVPDSGVVANIRLPLVDVDAWQRALATVVPATPDAERTEGAADSAHAQALAFLPTSVALRANELVVDRRHFNKVVVGLSRDGTTWRASLEAQELSGYVEYRPPGAGSAGKVYARLSRLTLAPGTATDFETLLDEQPTTVPALDIAVDDFELRGKRLGRVEIEAVNRGGVNGEPREWRLNKLNIAVPEATFAATGHWIALTPATSTRLPTPRPSNPTADRRRTVMDFKFEISDAGALLGRLGMKDVVKRGQGKLQGQVTWLGSPLSPDYPSMGGKFNVDVASGQFLKADPGLAKLLGVLSLQALPRRLLLDFRDVFSEGFAFDSLHGDISIDAGMASTSNLQMKGVNAAVMMDGKADIARETQHLRVLVVPEVNAGAASLLASAFNPAVALSTFIAQYILRKPLMEAATQEFLVDGTWADPKVTRVDTPH